MPEPGAYLDPSSWAELSRRYNLGSPITQDLSGMVRNTVTFPQRLMQTAAQTPFGLRRSDFTDIPGEEPIAPLVARATDLATNMVGAPVLTTTPATLGSGAVRRGMGALEGEILPPAASTALPGVTNLQRAKLGPMLEQLEKLGATPEQIRTFTPVEAYKWIKDRQGAAEVEPWLSVPTPR